MLQVLKSFAYYPAHFVGVCLLMVGNVVSWFCFLGVLLFSALMLAGEFPERWGVAVGLAAAGVVIRLVMEFYIRTLARLNPGWNRP